MVDINKGGLLLGDHQQQLCGLSFFANWPHNGEGPQFYLADVADSMSIVYAHCHGGNAGRSLLNIRIVQPAGCLARETKFLWHRLGLLPG